MADSADQQPDSAAPQAPQSPDREAPAGAAVPEAQAGAAVPDREARSAAVPDREARSAAVPDREARSAAVPDREARSAAVPDREARSAAVIDRPRLRPLDAFPIDNPGAADPAARHLLCLRDPSGVAEDSITLPPLGVAVIDLCDGTRTRAEICAAFAQRYRSPLRPETLDALLQRLEDAHMLDSQQFRSYAARLFSEFARAESRPPLLAGKSYSSDPVALTEQLGGYFAPPRGPGLPEVTAPQQQDAPPAPLAIITPHVDFARGGPAYAWAYRPLLQCQRLPKLIILLGTDHGATDGPEDLYTLTRKHFETPLGRLETDQDAVLELLEAARQADPALPDRLLRGEYRHRGEHSLEFQAVWLRYVLSRRPAGAAGEVKILPVLCGSLGAFLNGPKALEPATTAFLGALRKVTQAHTDVLWLCAADLAHVGPRYGDKESVTPADCESLERRDRQTLRPVCALDAAGWFHEIRRESDSRRVCGLSPIYTLLQAAGPALKAADKTGQLRCYAQCHTDPGSIVSIASVTF